jgi:hypothetical protein
VFGNGFAVLFLALDKHGSGGDVSGPGGKCNVPNADKITSLNVERLRCGSMVQASVCEEHYKTMVNRGGHIAMNQRGCSKWRTCVKVSQLPQDFPGGCSPSSYLRSMPLFWYGPCSIVALQSVGSIVTTGQACACGSRRSSRQQVEVPRKL